MKTAHRICLLSVLLLVLTTSTFAGQIDTPGTPAPPPPNAALAATPGEIVIGETSSEPESDSYDTTSFADAASSLLQIMLSIF